MAFPFFFFGLEIPIDFSVLFLFVFLDLAGFIFTFLLVHGSKSSKGLTALILLGYKYLAAWGWVGGLYILAKLDGLD